MIFEGYIHTDGSIKIKLSPSDYDCNSPFVESCLPEFEAANPQEAWNMVKTGKIKPVGFGTSFTLEQLK